MNNNNHSSIRLSQTGKSSESNSLGMRPMQERAYEKRGEQYLLIKSPPASGKSRALMFIALDKVYNQGLKQVIIAVPEKSIGSSFNNESLKKYGFWSDWEVNPRWNLCNAPGEEGGNVSSLNTFLTSDDKFLICTHQTFRFAFDKLGPEAFDDRVIAIDEFHHSSANPDNKLGSIISELISRNKTHITAMTGSYFRGDAEAVLKPIDEELFETVTYTYYEQLNGYKYLKKLDIGYYFYSGAYIDDILKVLDVDDKTIIHIPNVNSRESTKDKIKEVEHIINELGEWEGTDPKTGFQLVKTKNGKLLKIADLVDPETQPIVQASLRSQQIRTDKDFVDIIIALQMAKEGFDWIWCNHALTAGYRSSLTEIVQIIGRATRDAPGKESAKFTNLIAEPDASEQSVAEAVNDTLKAISASLLMEQVLAPRFEFRAKKSNNSPTEGFDYGNDGFDKDKCNIGFDSNTGKIEIEITGLVEPQSKESKRICKEDLNEIIASFIQNKQIIEKGTLDSECLPEEITQIGMGKIISEKYPNETPEDQEAIRQHCIAALNFTQEAKKAFVNNSDDSEISLNSSLIDGVKKFAMDVRELDIDLIDNINPFSNTYAISTLR